MNKIHYCEIEGEREGVVVLSTTCIELGNV